MKSISVFFLLLFLGTKTFSQVPQYKSLDGQWLFIKDSIVSNVPDDKSWTKVTVPHTWNINDGQAGKGKDEWQSEKSYYRGSGAYTKHLTIKKIDKNSSTFIRFEAVCQSAKVYVNGQFVGEHKGAFNAFAFDITDQLQAGKNVILVKATNAKDKALIPLGGDFTMFGGIYRKVWLITKKKVCISPLHYASSGVYLKQTKISETDFEIEATTKILNKTDKPQNITAQIKLFDAANKLVTLTSTTQTISANATESVLSKFKVSNPILWHSTDNPYLYKTTVTVLQGEEIVDAANEFIGFRTFRVDPIKGAFLNEKYIKVKGVNKHQDLKGKGWAISNADLDNDMKIIKEMGANAIRLAHYPHSKYTYTLADQLGFQIWAELPIVNSLYNTPEFHENTKNMLQEMIYQNYNHPSILMWSIGNEIGHRKTDDPVPLLTELNKMAHEIDPTRYTILASNGVHAENTIPDIFGVNAYPGWYTAFPAELENKLIERNKTVNNKGLSLSEYGAGASITQHQQNMTEKPIHNGKWHPEEWQAIQHEVQLGIINKNDWIWGSYVWNMFDFASAGRNEGDTPGINDKGLVTYDRKVRKDAFHFYKANWNPEPMVYITSRRHTERDSETTDIKVYSNAQNVRLYVNDIEQNVAVTKDSIIYIWKNIVLKEGKNNIKVKETSNSKEIIDECEWQFTKKE